MLGENIGVPGGEESQERNVEKEVRISWQILLNIEANNLGFRHTYDDMLPEEIEKGFRGDSLAVCNVSEIVPQEMIPEELSRLAKQFGVKPSLKQLDRYLDEVQKDQICEIFSQEMKEFIRSSLVWGRLGEEPDLAGVSEFLNNLDASFLLIKYKLKPSGRDKGEDSNLGGLGKAGVERITPEMIFGSVSSHGYLPLEHRDVESFSHGEEMNEKIFNERVLPHITEAVFKKVLEAMSA